MICIENAQIITPNAITTGHCLIADGVIDHIGHGAHLNVDVIPAKVIDAKGAYLAPGLIDL